MSRDFEFSNSDSIIDSTAIVTAMPVTMAAWVRPETANRAIISLGSTTSNTNYIELAIQSSGPNVVARFNAGTPQRQVASTGTVSVGVVIHTAAVFTSPTAIAVYLDGVEDTATPAGSAPSGLDGTGIGVRPRASNTAFFDGPIEHAAIWNVALTAIEISSLVAGASPLMIRPQNLVSYKPLIRDTRDVITGLLPTVTGTVVARDLGKVFWPTSSSGAFISLVAPGNTNLTIAQNETSEAQSSTVQGLIQIVPAQIENTESQIVTLRLLSQLTAIQNEDNENQIINLQGLLQVSANQNELSELQTVFIELLIQIIGGQSENSENQVANIEVLATPISLTIVQTEALESQSVNVEGLIQLLVAQIEENEPQVFNLELLTQLVINQAEITETQLTNIQGLVQIAIDQNEISESQLVLLQVLSAPINLIITQTETSEGQDVNLKNLIELIISQIETGETQVVNIESLVQINSAQIEFSESQAVSIKLLIEIIATQIENSEIQVISVLVGNAPINIIAVQIENSEIQVITLKSLVSLFIAQTETSENQIISLINPNAVIIIQIFGVAVAILEPDFVAILEPELRVCI